MSNPPKLAPKQELREQLEDICYWLGGQGKIKQAEQAMRDLEALFSSLLDELVPDKTNVNNGLGFSQYSFGHDQGYNAAIEQFTEKRKELGI